MSQHKRLQKVGEVITSDAVRRQRWLAGNRLLSVGIVAVVLAVVPAAYIYITGHTIPKPTSTHTAVGRTKTLSHQDQLAANLANAQDKLSQAKTNTDKASAYTALGAAYFNEGKYDQAVTAYNNAITADDSLKSQTLDTVAYTYAAAGERDKAIATYQQLIQILQAEPSTTESSGIVKVSTADRIQAYQQAIQTLQSGGSL